MPAVSKKQKKFMQAVANSPKFAKKVGVKQSIGREFTKEKDMKKAVKKMNMGGRAMADRAGAQAMSPAMKRRMEIDRMRAGAGGMKEGGKVKKNTAKMNNLEELGRVDAEKGYTKKGKKNLKSEKKRLVSQIKKGYREGGTIQQQMTQMKDARNRAMEKRAAQKTKAAGIMADIEGRALSMDKKGMTIPQMKDARGRAMATGGMLAKTGGSSAKMKAKGKKMMGGGKVKAYKKGGAVKGRGNASKRADGIAQRGHTRGRHV